jgi:hypothetical protein
MIRKFTYFLLSLSLISWQLTVKKIYSSEINIQWSENVSGDFSFKENWDYPEGVYKNDFGQISCEGLCPPEIDRMMNKKGKIFKDSLHAFYQLVDTSHQFHSIQSNVNAYEWAGTNFLSAIKKNTDTIVCHTHNNAATHSSLKLTITKNSCIPVIELTSISSPGTTTYACQGGQIEIDKNLWNNGVLKANFEFSFHDPEQPDIPLFWTGKIYALIENE